MIQRVQTIYLLITILLSSLLFVFPFQSNIVNFSEIVPFRLSILNYENNLLMWASVLNLVAIIEALVIIFLYKIRNIQISLCYYLMVLNLVIIGLMYWGTKDTDGLPTYKLPYIIPLINFILSFIAAHYIKKDEKLVKSADRLR